MAKIKTNSAQRTFDSLGSVPAMPNGYYSGDKPNPNLRRFVEENATPYDPETDDYNVSAFNQPITTTKATAIYNLHTYWSKKPHDAIRQYIRHYTQPGDVVLDPFCGSGGTALAALMEGRKAIAIDRSPAATFITKNYCTPVDPDQLQAAFEELKRKVQPEMDWLYETRCDRCGGEATTGYTVYSQVFQCPRCLAKVPLFDCLEVEGRTVAGKPKKLNVCPHCHKKGHQEVIKSQSEKFGAVPVLVSYLCQNACKPTRGERRHNDADRKKHDFFEKYDLGKLQEIDGKPIPHWYPPHNMMNVDDDSKPWGDKWRAGTISFRSVADRLLRTVADEVQQPVKKNLFENKDPDLFGSHVQSRWYLKETADQIDQAEQEKEDAAAARLAKFIEQYLAKRPEAEGVHYSDLFEQYLPVADKPRRLLADWLPEYFVKTPGGIWRLSSKEEGEQLATLRAAGTLRRIKRFANALIDGVPVRDNDRSASDADLLDWLRQCRRAGLYEQGRALYEKGGLNLANLDDQQQIEAEDAYRICARRGGEEEKKPKRQRQAKKKQ
ncbi:MAG TPA: DNA methyltransferase [Pirellulales bacterium]|nr:DNA methyltransferase [Pirellulales bacterium]